ncbi:MAG: glycoside hydrolase family 15 protein [Verrucomicrobiales bacterium]
MNPATPLPAFGKPGIDPRWTSSAKEGIGTAYHTASLVWFTLSHGILNEIYYPTVDTPNLRDLQFLITDGETFVHEEKRDLDHEVDYAEPGTLLFSARNTDPDGRYEITKEFLCAPHQSVVLVSGRLVIHDPALCGKLKLYLLAAPHVAGLGQSNTARVIDQAGESFLYACRHHTHMMIAAYPSLGRRSVGFVGASDGYRDLIENRALDWNFTEAEDGNVATIAEMQLSGIGEFVIGVGLGNTAVSASTAVCQALSVPWKSQRERYIEQWRRASYSNHRASVVPCASTGDEGSLFRASRCVILAHEDKTYQGATVASISIPWGESKSDRDLGGYHLVWPRDLYHSMFALLISGHEASALRALIWLANVQEADGSMPQNCWIDGTIYWKGEQLDETAAPVLLAWHLHRADALDDFDPWPLIRNCVRFLLLHGPVTAQERWEESSGYSPATLAAIISAMVCAAEFADDRSETETATLLRAYADWINDHIEAWTVTTAGTLVPGIQRHYLRICPSEPHAEPLPDTAELELANGGGVHPARDIVGGEFLELVRYGIRSASDPIVRDSVRVYDAQLKVDTPKGPCWRRYNFDGYGQHADGHPFDGAGYGGAWPLLTGERGHYALANGEDALPYIHAMENFSNAGQMLPEQVWPLPDLTNGSFKLGDPTGSAMPLCWAHAEYITLTKSAEAGSPIDRPDCVYQRYVANQTLGSTEFWLFARQSSRIRQGKSLTILLGAAATVRYSFDNWQSHQDVETTPDNLGPHSISLAGSNTLQPGSRIWFTFHWHDDLRWENENFLVTVTD